MNYEVRWSPEAEMELTRIWLGGRDRLRIQEAANRIEIQLQRMPASVGESRSGRVRVAFASPLVIHFEIDESFKRVTVTQVGRSKY
jgi:mRNA-degrading endonuclease RelE of RelBE toxin-antitoxin system